jgi:hypothetical protein
MNSQNTIESDFLLSHQGSSVLYLDLAILNKFLYTYLNSMWANNSAPFTATVPCDNFDYSMALYYGSLDRELNGNTASIKGTTTLTTKPNPLLQK